MRRELLTYCWRVLQTTKRELEKHYGWDLRRLDCAFLDCDEVDALLTRDGVRHGIFINVGLVFRAYAFLSSALGDPEILSDYLATDGLAGRAKRASGIRPRRADVARRETKGRTLNPERRDWLFRYLGMIVEHCYLHEAAHALRGHLLYLQRKDAPRFLSERRSVTAVGRSRVRDVEIDADFHALDMWFDITSPVVPAREVLQLDFLFQKLFTTLLLHQIFDEAAAPIAEEQRTDHPPPVHRAIYLTSSLVALAEQRFGLSREAIENVRHQAWWEASLVARWHGLAKYRWWGGVARQGWATYQRSVRRHAARIESKLDAFVEGLPDGLV